MDAVPLLTERIRDGEQVREPSSLDDIRALTRYDLETFDGSYKRIRNPHLYKVSIMPELRDLKLRLINNFLSGLS